MKRLALLLTLLAGCTRPSTVTPTQFAIDPATGICTPLASGVDRALVAGWQSCDNPCAGLEERACRSDLRCQVTLRGGTKSCEPVPQLIDPCKGLDATACQADSRCEMLAVGVGCDCPAGVPCDCPAPPPSSCALKQCGELTDGDACSARPDCTTTTPPPLPPTPVASGTTQPRSLPAVACFPIFGCDLNEHDCSKRHDCIRFYDDHGAFTSCGSTDHCATDNDCALGQRCNSDGRCAVEGCAGETEAECNADPACDPIYSLNCSPYSVSGGGGFCGPEAGGGGGAPLPDEALPPGSCTCEPTFTSCQQGGPVVTAKAVLVRDPAIIDDPFWALPRVLTSISGGADASAVADAWLAQLGTTTVVDGKTAAARPGAAQYIAALPHRADGLVDAGKLGFVPTALSNRLDLADNTSCGEARITYALTGGVTDRRHRMTVIVELRQPYDGAGCRTTAQTWVALSRLDGAALQSALQAIYAPLLTPANLKQVRTNEFLVGPQDSSMLPAAWELREFHLGSDARLHQVLLPLQVDPATANSSTDFATWAQANRDGLSRGTLTFPTQYQIPNGSEDGTVFSFSDPTLGNLVDKSTCAGCHTNATNSAFAHVAERFRGTGRAEISAFLEGELPKRATHLGLVAAGIIGAPLDVRPLH